MRASGQASRVGRRWLGGLAAAAAMAVSVQAMAAPEARPWPRWTAHDPASTAVVDHRPWSRFLADYLVAGEDGVNRLGYGRVDAAGRRALDGYIDGLARTPIDRYRRAEQLAYWINLYNALTVRVVLDHYPVASIRDIDISPGWFSDGPWGRKLVRVEGEALSLDDIEHRILRPVWHDPRIHYAVNCASLGCPALRPEAYEGASIKAQLDRAARDYVNGEHGVRFDGETLSVSSIYAWYRDDFGGSDRAVIAHLVRFAAPALAARLARSREIGGHFYDWSLNDAGPRP